MATAAGPAPSMAHRLLRPRRAPGWRRHHSSAPPPPRELGVYVHYPYCRRRCAYCAFNVYALPPGAPAVRTLAYQNELRHALKPVPPSRVRSVYFGGGTPSLASPDWFKACLDTIAATVPLDPSAEITVEANPADASRTLLEQLKALGINRISLGVQALDDAALTLFGRDHSVARALEAVSLAKQLFPGMVTLDFIWGRPNQTLADWLRELQEILQLADNHLSLYQLTLERGTRMFRDFLQSANMPSDNTLADMYEATVEMAAKHGFEQYEVSSFARRGAYGVHNMGYWLGLDYVGVGPGAHGRVTTRDGTRHKTVQIPAPTHWERACLDAGHGLAKTHAMTDAEVAREAVVFGLRMPHVGVSGARTLALTGVDVVKFLDLDAVAQLQRAGLLEPGTPDTLRCTPRGLAVVDSLLPRILL